MNGVEQDYVLVCTYNEEFGLHFKDKLSNPDPDEFGKANKSVKMALTRLILERQSWAVTRYTQTVLSLGTTNKGS